MNWKKSLVTTNRWCMQVAGVVAVALLAIFLVTLPRMQNAVSLTVGIAWPATTLTIVLLFRPQIAALIDDLVELRTKNVTIRRQELPRDAALTPFPSPARDAAPRGVSPSATALSASDRPLFLTSVAPAFRPLYNQYLARTKDRLSFLRATFADDDTDLAIAVAAESGAALQLERASRLIYQSQVDALADLKWHATTKGAFRPYFDHAAKTYPTAYAAYGFDQWFNFLVQFDLVEGTDDAIKVTPTGEALSMYMAQMGYTAVPA